MFNGIERIIFNHLLVTLSWGRRQFRRQDEKWLAGIRTVAIIVLILISLQFACYRSVQSHPPTVLSGEKLASATEVSYFQDIQPILQAHCQACHQPDAKRALGVGPKSRVVRIPSQVYITKERPLTHLHAQGLAALWLRLRAAWDRRALRRVETDQRTFAWRSLRRFAALLPGRHGRGAPGRWR